MKQHPIEKREQRCHSDCKIRSFSLWGQSELSNQEKTAAVGLCLPGHTQRDGFVDMEVRAFPQFHAFEFLCCCLNQPCVPSLQVFNFLHFQFRRMSKISVQECLLPSCILGKQSTHRNLDTTVSTMLSQRPFVVVYQSKHIGNVEGGKRYKGTCRTKAAGNCSGRALSTNFRNK